MIKPYFKSDDENFTLLHGDSFELLPQIEQRFDMVFADPPYFLSSDGLTFKNGKIQSVNKADWDTSLGIYEINEFNARREFYYSNPNRDIITHKFKPFATYG